MKCFVLLEASSIKCCVNKEYRCFGSKEKLRSGFFCSLETTPALPHSSPPRPMSFVRHRPSSPGPSHTPLLRGASPQPLSTSWRRRDTGGGSLLPSPFASPQVRERMPAGPPAPMATAAALPPGDGPLFKGV